MFKASELPFAQVEQAIVEYKDGKTLKAIAKEFNCSIPTVSKIPKDKGVTVRPKGRQKKVS